MGASCATPDADRRRSQADVTPARTAGVTRNERAFRVLVRNALFRRVQLAALGRVR